MSSIVHVDPPSCPTIGPRYNELIKGSQFGHDSFFLYGHDSYYGSKVYLRGRYTCFCLFRACLISFSYILRF
jgi:hypothetical protein